MAAEQAITISHEMFERLNGEAQARGLSIERLLEDLVKELASTHKDRLIEYLKAKGLLVSVPTASPNAPRNFKPVPISGQPLSQTIIEDRE